MRKARRTNVSDSGAAGDGDDDALAGLPGVGDLVVGAVLGQRGVDLVGEPQQRQLAQRGEVAAAGSSCDSAASMRSGA